MKVRAFWAFAQACPCPAPGPGRPGPAARSQHYLFHGFQLTNKVTKRKDKSMCARRDAIAQRCSPVSLPTVKPLSPPPRHLHQVPTDASVTIRLLIPTPRQRVIRISAETDDLAKSGSARQWPSHRRREEPRLTVGLRAFWSHWPPCGSCSFAPNICSSLPELCVITRRADQLGLGPGWAIT
jgi:hypothetical protein